MTRKLDVQAVIREVFKIYRDQAAVLLPAAAIIFVFTALIGAFLLSGGVIALIVLFAMQTLALTFYSGMVVNLVRDVQDGRRDSSVGDLFRAVLPVFLALLAVGLLVFLAFLAIGLLAGLAAPLGLLLLIVPGLFLLTIWAVVAPVVLLERPGIIQSFARSWQLVRGNFWPVFGAIVIVFLITFAVGFILRSIGAAADDVGLFIGSFIASVLTAPLSALLAAVLYFHLHAVKEGGAAPGTAVAGTTAPAPAGAGTTEPTREHSPAPTTPGQAPSDPQSPPAGPQSPSGPPPQRP